MNVRDIQLFILILIVLVISRSFPVSAQMTECELVSQSNSIVAENSCIMKSLREQIGKGQGDINTPESSIYLINRDPARSIRRGRQLFQRKFSLTEGLGPRVNADSSGDITTTRALGAGMTDSCAACHGRPKGSAGFGGDVVTRPDSRDAPHLFGLGIVEQLAEEMTEALRLQRDNAIARAASTGVYEKRIKLSAKGIDFGELKVMPGGEVDTSKINGIDEDLRVRPFFHQGGTASIREFVIGALKDEMGLQAWDPVLCKVTDPQNPQAVSSPSGFKYNPDVDEFERPPVCDSLTDADADGVASEINPALIDHLEFYLLNYFKPAQYKQSPITNRGRRVMDEIGCTSCHISKLTIDSDRRVADVETNYDAKNGIFNKLFAIASTRFGEPVIDNDAYPVLPPSGAAFTVKNFFSDLKRHDLGEAFHEREYDGSLVKEFVTEPLWGVGSTAPYGHDGRSINLDAVIRRHGGQAKPSKLKYERLAPVDQLALREFLNTLVLFPPDDTASNLNPGEPGNNAAIQTPQVHGNIRLSELFQIPNLGSE